MLDVLIVFRLQDDHYFLYPTVAGQHSLSNIIHDCSILYEFVKEHPIFDVIEHVGILDPLEIDKHVKTYMKAKGFDRVRGGSYTDIAYPEAVKLHVEKEVALSFHDYVLAIEKLCSIESEYKDKKQQKDSTIIELTKKREEYVALLRKRDLLSSIYLCFHDDVDWIRRRISASFIAVSKEDKTRYKEILHKMKHILFVFTKFVEDEHYVTAPVVCELPQIYIYSPNVLLDSFFLHKSVTIEQVKLEPLLQRYEYMTNVILNRFEDVNFSINQYPKDFMQMSAYTISYLQYEEYGNLQI
uniref:Uncharacterized protein n=1 Tax=viral metagenome TaxID=1070528 RepID=A0A6C0I4P4_9ZZZZ